MKEICRRLEDLDIICGSLPLLMDAFNNTKRQQLNLEALVKELKEDVCEYVLESFRLILRLNVFRTICLRRSCAIVAATLQSLGRHNNEASFNQVSQLSIDLKSSASRCETAVQALAKATESRIFSVHGEYTLQWNSFLKTVSDGLDSIVQKIQESEDVILTRLRRTRLIPSISRILRTCIYHIQVMGFI